MANYPSAKKRIRQTERRTARNKYIRTSVRTYIKRVRAAIAKGDGETARTALGEAVKRIDQAVTKGIYHRNTGARYISRLTQRVNQL